MDEVEEITLRIENSQRLNGQGYLVLPESELREFGDALLAHASIIRFLHPIQLADLLRRLYGVNGIKSWSLSKAGKPTASTQSMAKDSPTPAAMPVDTTIANSQLPCRTDGSSRSTPQPIETEPIVETHKDHVIVGDRQERNVGAGFSNVGAQGPTQAPKGSLNPGSPYPYLTPADSPRKRRRKGVTASPFPSGTNRITTESPLTNASPTPALNPLLTIPDHVVCLLRKACEAGEEAQCMREADLKQALSLGAHLIDPDPRLVLTPLLNSWNVNASQDLHALGLPTEWRGVRAAAAYVTILKDNTIADAVGQRVARMLLVLNYERICESPESHCPRPRRAGEKRKAYVMNCITHACFSRDPSKSERDVIHNFLRQGRWLWIISSIVGLGFVLICSDELMSTIKNVSITNDGVNAIATSALYMRPRMVALLHSLEPAVADLMSGQISKALCGVIQDETGILGLSALSCTNGADQAHLDHQHSTGNWEPVDLALAVHKIKERLCDRFRGAHLSVEYDSLNETSTGLLNQLQPHNEATVEQWFSVPGDETLIEPQLDHDPHDSPMRTSLNQCEHDGNATADQWTSTFESEIMTNSELDLTDLDEILHNFGWTIPTMEGQPLTTTFLIYPINETPF